MAVGNNAGKARQYEAATQQIQAVLEGERNLTVKMTTIACLLSRAFPDRFYWTGFYCVDPDQAGELHVGPYQGTLGCLRIAFGRGVCGTAAQTGETQIVADVHAIENHIACDSLTESEIVVPVKDKTGKLLAVLDIDSTELAAFDEIDAKYLEDLVSEVFA